MLPRVFRGPDLLEFLYNCLLLHFLHWWVLPVCKFFSDISAPDTPPQFLLARKLSDYEVELSWQPPLEANSDILYYSVRVWWVFKSSQSSLFEKKRFKKKTQHNATWTASLFVRNETTELWQNVTTTSVVINVDSESRYNASVSSWTRLGDGGVLIYISFTTIDAGAGEFVTVNFIFLTFTMFIYHDYLWCLSFWLSLCVSFVSGV